MHIRGKKNQPPRPPGYLRRPPARPYSTGGHLRDRHPPRLQRKFPHFWASTGTTGDMLRILWPLPDLSTFSPGRMWSSIEVRSVKTPSTTSRPSSPPAQSLPSWTSTSRSGYTPAPPPQALELSSHKYKKARSALFAVPRSPLTSRRKPTPPLNWSTLPSPLPSSVPT